VKDRPAEGMPFSGIQICGTWLWKLEIHLIAVVGISLVRYLVSAPNFGGVRSENALAIFCHSRKQVLLRN
jgi:hypothetical protein